MSDLDLKTFNEFRALIYERSGVTLSDSKQSLVLSRIGKRMRELGIERPRDYLRYAREHEDQGEIIRLVNAICTNFTSFFREADHFDFLREVVDEWYAQGQRRFRFWSAASSTGEEPYTLAMVLLEAFRGRSVDMRILATDLSTKALAVARRGEYPADRLEGIPPALRKRYFRPVASAEKTVFRVDERLRALILFRRLNLSTPPFPMRGPLDVVFCRNVMIYFDNRVRSRLVKEIHRLLKPDGYLCVGHTESLSQISSDFRMIRPSVYRAA